jgi:tRNA (Thr-GGU) A37 N-methylase
MLNFKSRDPASEFRPITLHPIGHVERDEGDEGLSFEDLRAHPARIVLDPALTDGLLGLEPGSDIVVLFWFHRSTGYDLQLHPRGDPSRPNPIAVTTARIRRVEGNVLEVDGLDALDGSPVLDIKVHASCFDTPYT